MAERWSDRFGLCLRAAVLSVCSLCLLMFFSFPQCRLIIDPAGSVGPSSTWCDSDWKLVLGSAWLQPSPDTPAWWYAVCVEVFVSKGEKATEVESRGNRKPQSYRAMVANHAGRLLQASATLRDGGESILGSLLNLL